MPSQLDPLMKKRSDWMMAAMLALRVALAASPPPPGRRRRRQAGGGPGLEVVLLEEVMLEEVMLEEVLCCGSPGAAGGGWREAGLRYLVRSEPRCRRERTEKSHQQKAPPTPPNSDDDAADDEEDDDDGDDDDDDDDDDMAVTAINWVSGKEKEQKFWASKETVCFIHWAPLPGESGWKCILPGAEMSARPATSQEELWNAFGDDHLHAELIKLLPQRLHLQLNSHPADLGWCPGDPDTRGEERRGEERRGEGRRGKEREGEERRLGRVEERRGDERSEKERGGEEKRGGDRKRRGFSSDKQQYTDFQALLRNVGVYLRPDISKVQGGGGHLGVGDDLLQLLFVLFHGRAAALSITRRSDSLLRTLSMMGMRACLVSSTLVFTSADSSAILGSSFALSWVMSSLCFLAYSSTMGSSISRYLAMCKFNTFFRFSRLGCSSAVRASTSAVMAVRASAVASMIWLMTALV
ncbi:LOW QUALITY PROTEIN: hypothetical protein CRUP_026427 [Coryphaenoides rupestris]|nr:LOW QUALITY PROTEIN: hypothetical protein CRUP_026427 [Coryphaenoides rupestris]